MNADTELEDGYKEVPHGVDVVYQLIMMRHAAVDYSFYETSNGKTDDVRINCQMPLTTEGEIQAQKLGEQLSIGFPNYIFLRPWETAATVADGRIPVSRSHRTAELVLGMEEGSKVAVTDIVLL